MVDFSKDLKTTIEEIYMPKFLYVSRIDFFRNKSDGKSSLKMSWFRSNQTSNDYQIYFNNVIEHLVKYIRQSIGPRDTITIGVKTAS